MEHVKSYVRVTFPFPRKETVYCPFLYEIISKFRYESLKWISQGIINAPPPHFQDDKSRIYYLHVYGYYIYVYQSIITCSIICPLFTVVFLNIHIGNTIREGFKNTETRHRLMITNLLTSLQNTSAHSK